MLSIQLSFEVSLPHSGGQYAAVILNTLTLQTIQ